MVGCLTVAQGCSQSDLEDDSFKWHTNMFVALYLLWILVQSFTIEHLPFVRHCCAHSGHIRVQNKDPCPCGAHIFVCVRVEVE